jgi:cytidylate kinase
MIIAIDGPAGSGKSSVAQAVARALDFRYLDTGAMYRAIAERALALGASLDDEPAVARIASEFPISFGYRAGDLVPNRVLISGLDVTQAIRTPEVDAAVSFVARMPLVRKAMVAQQRELAEGSDIVVEGRDIGTVVFPRADVKVFLTASAEERARRRAAQNVELGQEAEPGAVLDAMARRDAIDSTREHSPLAAAPDAVVLDTTAFPLDDVVQRIVSLVRGRGA